MFIEELNCQREALSDLSEGNNKVATQYVLYDGMIIASTFREIINDHEKKFNRVPTSDELIWYTSEILHKNIRNLLK